LISGTGQQRANRPGSLPVLQWTMPCMRRRVVRRVVFSPMIAREAIDIPAQERIEQPLCRMRSDALGVQSRLFRVPFARIQDRARSCAGRLSITAMRPLHHRHPFQNLCLRILSVLSQCRGNIERSEAAARQSETESSSMGRARPSPRRKRLAVVMRR